MKKIGMHLLALIFASQVGLVSAQTPQKEIPVFSLTIEEQSLSAQNAAGTYILSVKYTNISKLPQKDGCMVTPFAYHMLVLRNGVPVVENNSKTEPEENTNTERNGYKIKVTHTEADACHGVDNALEPGKSVKFSLWVTSKYDMTIPGNYEITVTRETDPWHSEKGVTVKSNTITIVVPEP